MLRVFVCLLDNDDDVALRLLRARVTDEMTRESKFTGAVSVAGRTAGSTGCTTG